MKELFNSKFEEIKQFLTETFKIAAIFSIVFFSIHISLIIALHNNNPAFVVTSNSMLHQNESWRDYYTAMGIDTSNFPIQGGFARGDILLAEGVNPNNIAVGDVIIFEASGTEIAHRVVEISFSDNKPKFKTKGDANMYSAWSESSIFPENIKGRVVFVLPKIGHIFLWLSGK